MAVHEVWDTDGNLISREEVPDPDPAPIAADEFIAQVAAMTDAQKADLRAALGL